MALIQTAVIQQSYICDLGTHKEAISPDCRNWNTGWDHGVLYPHINFYQRSFNPRKCLKRLEQYNTLVIIQIIHNSNVADSN